MVPKSIHSDMGTFLCIVEIDLSNIIQSKVAKSSVFY